MCGEIGSYSSRYCGHCGLPYHEGSKGHQTCSNGDCKTEFGADLLYCPICGHRVPEVLKQVAAGTIDWAAQIAKALSIAKVKPQEPANAAEEPAAVKPEEPAKAEEPAKDEPAKTALELMASLWESCEVG